MVEVMQKKKCKAITSHGLRCSNYASFSGRCLQHANVELEPFEQREERRKKQMRISKSRQRP